MLVLAVSGGLAISQVVLREGWLPGAATPTATPAALPQVWPESQLPAPYDWSGVQAALAPRGFELNEPAEEERRALTVPVDAAITTVLESYVSLGDASHFTNAVTEVSVGDGARSA